MRPCSSIWPIQNMSASCGPSTGTFRRSARSFVPPAWSRWPWVTRIFSTVTARSAIALSISSRSPPGSVTAPRLVSVHQSSEQFCWNGVTGIITAWIGGFGGSGAAVSDMADERAGRLLADRASSDVARPGAAQAPNCRTIRRIRDAGSGPARQAAPASSRSTGSIQTAVSWNATPPTGPTAIGGDELVDAHAVACRIAVAVARPDAFDDDGSRAHAAGQPRRQCHRAPVVADPHAVAVLRCRVPPRRRQGSGRSAHPPAAANRRSR